MINLTGNEIEDQTMTRPRMTIKEAQAKINAAVFQGRLSGEEGLRYSKMIRRTGDYGNKWSWQRQAEMRAAWVSEL